MQPERNFSFCSGVDRGSKGLFKLLLSQIDLNDLVWVKAYEAYWKIDQNKNGNTLTYDFDLAE